MSQDAHRSDSFGADAFVEEGASVDIFGFLQWHRRRFGMATVVVGLLTAAALAVSRALPPVDRVALMEITPTFTGARDGRYPNRAPFSPQDIVATSVVEPVWRAQGLEDIITLPDLCRNLQIVAGGDDLDMLRSEYLQKLSNSKLTATERSALEAEFAAKSKALSSGSLTILLGSPARAITDGQMERLLGAIPVEWARASDVAGARAYDYPLPLGKELRASAAQIAPDNQAAAAVIHAERMKSFIDSLSSSIQAMSKLPGSDNVKDSKGASIVDLGHEVNSIRRNMVIPAYIDTMQEAKSRDPDGYASIRSTRRKLLESELNSAKERARVLTDAFTDYANETRMVRRASPDPSVDDPRQAGILANVDGTFIDRVIEQAVKSRDVEYRRELTDRKLQAELDVIDRTTTSEFETWLETTVQERSASRTALEASTKRLGTLTETLAAYADRAHEIMAILSARNLNSASTMYLVEMAPAVRSVPIVSLRTLALSGFGAWAVMMALVTVRAMSADRRQASRLTRLGGPNAPMLDEHVAANVAELADRRPSPRRLAGELREPVG
jgi:AraC-like DNA-binding protein